MLMMSELNLLNNLDWIILFSLIFIPGYLTRSLIAYKIPDDKHLLKDTVLETLVYGLLSFLTVGIWSYKLYQWHILCCSFILGAISIFILPMLIAYGFIKVQKSSLFSKIFGPQEKSSWDYLFNHIRSINKPVTLAVTLKNSDYIIGTCAGNSYATSYPNQQDLFLETIYEIKEEEVIIKEGSEGLYISKDQINKIEIFDYFFEEGENDE